jgi:hypothetical protein
MSLLGNYSVILKNPTTFIGGTTVSNCRNAFNETGQLRQRFYPETVDGLPTSATLPTGTESPYAFLLAINNERVELTSTTRTVGLSNISANLTNGIGMVGNISGTGALTISMAILYSLVGTSAGIATLTGNISNALSLSGSATGEGNLSGSLKLLQSLLGDILGTGSLSGDMKQNISLSGNIFVNSGTATVNELVAGVWGAVASQYNESGTMGQKLNGAGSAGDPWTTDLASYTTPGTAGQLLKDNPALLEIINEGVKKASLLVPHDTDL